MSQGIEPQSTAQAARCTLVMVTSKRRMMLKTSGHTQMQVEMETDVVRGQLFCPLTVNAPRLLASYGMADVVVSPRAHYEKAIGYLVDFCMDEMLS